ncbi:STAS domain-containing protein [Actinomadura soli]|uniref:Anti-sigma factor antagonist n=1 Tax=Actinomadura soli TaxID=2508997 RepID=A0A5C4J6L4_9ACTN|nr:anti-sigma factor antagonist [Actinomadura soli]TMQ91500.1 STAS domain-containing protein [Actinomadura soli]
MDHVDEFRVSIGRAGGTVTVTVVGEVDMATVGVLRVCVGAVLDGIVRGRVVEQVVVQVSGMSFIDASGLGALVDLRKRARREGALLLLAGVSPALWRLLKLTGLTGLAGPGEIDDG